MIAEIVLIPNGFGLDAAKASAQYVARGLSAIGMKVREHISVCPDSGQLQQAVATALARSNILLTIGGMGEDSDFVAKTVLSQGLRLPLEENPEALLGLREFCRRTGNPFLKTDEAFIMLPQGATVFPGIHGKLPGCAISSAKQHIIMLPETPAEIAPMFNRHVTAYLGGTPSTTITRTLRTYGARESGVMAVLSDLMDSANPAVTVQKDGGEVLVRVSAHAASAQQAAALCTPVLQDIVDRLGDSAYGLDVDSMQAAVVSKLRKKELDLAIVESGTFGMLARMISETPSGQEFLRYSVTADTLDAKIKKLGISKKILKKTGNVSEYAAVAAASAARERSGATLGVSVLANTGDDTRRDCPAGVVYIAVCDAHYVYIKKLIIGDGGADPDVITDAALSRALNMTRLVLDYYPDAYSASIPLESALCGESVTDLLDCEDVEIADESQTVPEPAGIRRILTHFHIHKTDRREVKVRKFVFIIAMLIFFASAGYVGYHYYSGYVAKKQAAELQNMFEYGDMDNVEVSPDFPRSYSLKFAGLWNVNQDVAAYLSIPDTSVKYPIVQAGDNDYYLRRDFYGNPNQYGIPFLDYRVNIKRPSDNIVIYGHNMKDGQIFGELIQYSPKSKGGNGNIDYYKQHPLIDFTTVYKEGQYKIFSVFITNAYENQGPVFAYHDFIDAANFDGFERYISEVKKRSMINTTVDVRKGDELLTLSTCTYEFEDARLVIVARALRRDEDPGVDTESAALNPAPLMPDIWYRTFGGNKPVGEAIPEIATETVSDSQSADDSPESGQLNGTSETADSSRETESGNPGASVQEESRIAEESRLAEEAAPPPASSATESSDPEEESREPETESSPFSEESGLDGELDSDILAMRSAPGLTKFYSFARRSEQDTDGAEPDDGEPGASEDAGADEPEAENAGNDWTITAKVNGKTSTDELDIISRVVQREVGPGFEVEAIKAQAVAAYTFISHANINGSVPYVAAAASADDKITDAVSEVLGELVFYQGKVAFTPYHATSAGKTTSSRAVWGGNYRYLVSVDSAIDKKAPNYKMRTVLSLEDVAGRISSSLGIEPDGDPSEWFTVLNRIDSYNGDMAVCGETRSAISGQKITGRIMRENVLNLRSACFTVKYDPESEEFTFITYGYGHGVGMSQTGANLYAKKGWDYKKILSHYYPGTTVKAV